MRWGLLLAILCNMYFLDNEYNWKTLRLTTFGESYGPYIGGVIDGCPAGLHIDQQLIQDALEGVRGNTVVSTPRKRGTMPQFIWSLLDETTRLGLLSPFSSPIKTGVATTTTTSKRYTDPHTPTIHTKQSMASVTIEVVEDQVPERVW